ncbi:MAG: n-acetylglutamate synthase [Bryobacteraceae bacterium]
MPPIDYHDRYFRPISNSANGQVTGETEFHYRQTGDLLTGTYSGGGIRFGQLVGRVHPDNSLEFVYQHLTDSGELRTGRCRSRHELLPEGRIRLHEDWQWTNGDHSRGQSVVEETLPR